MRNDQVLYILDWDEENKRKEREMEEQMRNHFGFLATRKEKGFQGENSICIDHATEKGERKRQSN